MHVDQFRWATDETAAGSVGFSRRGVLQLGLCGGVVACGVIPQQPAEANPLFVAAGRLLFTSAVSWLVGRALDRIFPSDPGRLAVRPVREPRPSNNTFHNRFADRYEIASPRYRIPPTRSNSFGYYLAVGPNVRCGQDRNVQGYTDMATAEIHRSRVEYHGRLVPISRRMPAGSSREFRQVCAKYRVRPDAVQLDYARRFQLVGTRRGAGSGASQPAGQSIQQQGPVQQQPTVSDREWFATRAVLGFGVTERRSGERALLVVS